ncbi:hypothetical protein EK0264_07985 [Epidermidibacterium keratini]|uniref:Cytochrome ubiquinol oxidase subunit I n=1 Tax=Epidermidibacterium keratini TaxID=1891644 RepID=A0A7L4YMD9_9ACTN|nr:cytochrome ubiquinol oxidase subunit I [Epidermidibacterium keratini]QHC00222.1 hypothetical protein EK0264_07985 [Epidermidibacterium keratini]
MDEIVLARLLFATTASVHYLFVAVTLGLTPILATAYTWSAVRRRRAPDAVEMLSRLYVANYGFGIVAGLVMELQMSMLWTGPGTDVYSPIAGLLALETVVAFFLESTLLGLWLAGREILPAWVQAAIFWGIVITAYASAIFIVTANAYLHYPIQIEVLDAAAFMSLLMRPATLWTLLHITSSSLVVGAFWCASLGAARLRSGAASTGKPLVRIGVLLATVASPLMAASGAEQFGVVRPNGVQGAAWGAGLIDAMITAGSLIMLLTWVVVLPLMLTGRIYRRPWMLEILRYGVVVPMVVIVLGWVGREVSRQPWFIVGLVRIEDAASPIGPVPLVVASVLFVALSVGTLGLAIGALRRIIRGVPVLRASAT